MSVVVRVHPHGVRFHRISHITLAYVYTYMNAAAARPFRRYHAPTSMSTENDLFCFHRHRGFETVVEGQKRKTKLVRDK